MRKILIVILSLGLCILALVHICMAMKQYKSMKATKSQEPVASGFKARMENPLPACDREYPTTMTKIPETRKRVKPYSMAAKSPAVKIHYDCHRSK